MIAFMSMSNLDESIFLNVDLEVFSKSNLQPLVDAMGNKVVVLHVSLYKRTHEAHVELSGSHLPRTIRHLKSPELLIVGFCSLIQELPPTARELWDAAKSRIFDIGIGPPKRDTFYRATIGREAIRAAAEVRAQIAITVYGPMKTVRRPKTKQPANS
jgi:hypothetical protein